MEAVMPAAAVERTSRGRRERGILPATHFWKEGKDERQKRDRLDPVDAVHRARRSAGVRSRGRSWNAVALAMRELQLCPTRGRTAAIRRSGSRRYLPQRRHAEHRAGDAEADDRGSVRAQSPPPQHDARERRADHGERDEHAERGEQATTTACACTESGPWSMAVP